MCLVVVTGKDCCGGERHEKVFVKRCLGGVHWERNKTVTSEREVLWSREVKSHVESLTDTDLGTD